MAHSYSHLYGIACTGLRFFTVYGPWGRPDMAPMIFADAIINKKILKVFNHGKMSRSFTFIDDVIDILIRLIQKPAIPDENFDSKKPSSATSWCSHRIFNCRLIATRFNGINNIVNICVVSKHVSIIKNFDW